MIRFESQESFVLHARLYLESSLLLELFTPDYGRISAIAKGARRPKSRMRGLLQPFVPLLVSCVGRGELLTLCAVDSAGISPLLSGRHLMSALYLNELLVRLLHRHDAHPDLFWQYKATLLQLETTEDAQEILRLFEKFLLKTLGYELPLLKDAESGALVEAENFYTFDPLRGPQLIGGKAVGDKQLPGMFKGRSLLALAEENLKDRTVLADVKRLMRQALAVHLGSKPLESRKLLV